MKSTKSNGYKKLILFDIDGTLMASGKGARISITEAMRRVFGKSAKITYQNAAGRTDKLIVLNLMKECGVPEKEVMGKMDEIIDIYISLVRKNMNKDNDITVYDGIPEIVDRLSKDPEALLALVTGNVEEGAEIKLGAAGLWEYFEFGAYGSDSIDRNDLPGVAVQRALEFSGIKFKPEDIIVIGDTAKDVICGKYIGAKTMVVIRRREFEEEILETKPDYVFYSFEDVDRVISTIMGK